MEGYILQVQTTTKRPTVLKVQRRRPLQVPVQLGSREKQGAGGPWINMGLLSSTQIKDPKTSEKEAGYGGMSRGATLMIASTKKRQKKGLTEGDSRVAQGPKTAIRMETNEEESRRAERRRVGSRRDPGAFVKKKRSQGAAKGHGDGREVPGVTLLKGGGGAGY